MKTFSQILTCAFGILMTPLAYPQAPSPATADRSQMIQMHEKAAKMHQNAAECMKSESPMEACENQMMKDCPMGQSQCRQMGKMMSGHMGMMGKMHGETTNRNSPKTE